MAYITSNVNHNEVNQLETSLKRFKSEKEFNEEKKLLNRNSFERFGDDLTELLLSYLPIGDKFKFECISRQWKRLIFNRQYRVVLDFYEVLDNNTIQTPKDKQKYLLLFTHLFRKLKNLRDIECHHFLNSLTFESMITNCSLIQRISFNGFVKNNLFNQLFDKFGQRITSINFDSLFNRNFDNIFKMCPNLKEVVLNKHLTHLSETLLPKLVNISFPLNINSEELRQFTKKYFKQIKTICLKFDISNVIHSSTDEINRCLILISKYENLQSLTLKFRTTSKKNLVLDSSLRLIAIKCKELKTLSLKSSHFITEENLLSVLNKYQYLVKLKVYINHTNNQILGTVADLNSSSLKYFTLEFNGLTDDIFSDIHIFLPNLKRFESNDCINNNLTNQTLISFSKLKTLRSLSMIGKSFTESGALYLINNCQQITRLSINYDMSRETLGAISVVANRHPKIAYELYVNTWPNKQMFKFSDKELPINLSIIQF